MIYLLVHFCDEGSKYIHERVPSWRVGREQHIQNCMDFYDGENRFTATFMYRSIKLERLISQIFTIKRNEKKKGEVVGDVLKMKMRPQQRKEDGEALNSHEKETGET